MNAAPYPWQQAQWERLQQARATDRLPHALLIHGPQGAGLHAFAEHLAAWMLCTGTHAAPCGNCKDCLLFAAATHPDMIRLQPEEEGRQIRIEGVRDLIDVINLKSHGGRFKLALITPAEAMNRNAANALLKTLEEPPPGTLILLVTHRPRTLPVTIRSRAQGVEIHCRPHEPALDWLRRQLPDEGRAELCLELCGGGPLLALEWLRQGHLELRGKLLTDLARLREAGADCGALAQRWNTLDAGLLYRWNRTLLQDLARLLGQPDSAAIRNQDLLGDLQALAKRLDLKHTLTSLDLLNACQRLAEGQGNLRPVNLLETFMLHWSGCLQADERKVI